MSKKEQFISKPYNSSWEDLEVIEQYNFHLKAVIRGENAYTKKQISFFRRRMESYRPRIELIKKLNKIEGK